MNQKTLRNMINEIAIKAADSNNYNKYIITNTQNCEFMPYDSTRLTIYTTSFKIQ